MKCDKCGSKKIASINAHCIDSFSFFYGGKEYNGYVPEKVGIGYRYGGAEDSGGDDVSFYYCIDCGKMQGKFPLDEKQIKKLFKKKEN